MAGPITAGISSSLVSTINRLSQDDLQDLLYEKFSENEFKVMDQDHLSEDAIEKIGPLMERLFQ